jgi:transcriptional regulator with GAF, ATPase, and Fis domain/predicted negative regulator of RcsB-dependent stress response
MNQSRLSVVQHRYRLEEPLGAGGVASTHRVTDLLQGRQVALKLLELASSSAVAEFRQEFSRLCGLFHPGLVQALDFGVHREGAQQRCFYTAELVEGQNLTHWARQAKWCHVVRPLVDAIAALGFLHHLGLRHGDFKADNIVVTRHGRGVLVDLGCARPIEGRRRRGGYPSAAVAEPLSGTPGYMAPELLRGEGGDARSDLFSVGRTLAFLAEQVRAPRAMTDLAQQLQAAEPVNRLAKVSEVLEVMAEGDFEPTPPAGRALCLVGRQEELRRFDEFLDHFLAGRPGPRCLYLHGPPGVGRSRLTLELKWRAQQRLDVVETPQGAAAQPFAALLGHLARQGLPAGQMGESAGSPPAQPAPAAPPSAVVDVALAERVQALLAGGNSPWLLVVDDADRLSPPERELWRSLLRLAEPGDRLALVCTGRTEPSDAASSVMDVWSLQPLAEADVAQWAGQLVSPAYLPSLLERSRGLPGQLEFLLGEIGAGRLHESDLAGSARFPSTPTESLELADLPRSAQRALALVALLGAQLDQAAQDDLGIEPATWALLHRQRWLRPRGQTWELWREQDGARLLAALPLDVGQSLHRDAAAWLAQGARPEEQTTRRGSALVAQQVALLVNGEAIAEAEALALAHQELVELDPLAWREPAQSLAQRSNRVDVLLMVAEILQRAGHPERGLELLEGLTQAMGEGETVLRRCHQAKCLLKLGRAKEALPLLEKVHGEVEPAVGARRADLLARIFIQLGRYDEALALAQQALAGGPGKPWRALFHEDVGLAASYLGRSDLARDHLARALELQRTQDRPRVAVRLLSYQGIHQFREGRLDEASAAYREALELAERHGLSDLVASAALNLGTATHQRGDWGQALEAYERGLRLARALGKDSTEVTLRFNLANLLSDVGRFDRADQLAQQALEGAGMVGGAYFEGAVPLLRGEIALEQGRYDDARLWLTEALQQFVARKAAREQAEVQMRLVELSLSQNELEQARQAWMDLCRGLGGALSQALALPLALLQGRLELAQSQPARALVSFEKALAEAQESGQRAWVGESARLLSEAYVRQAESGGEGAAELRELAQSHSRRSRQVWARIGLSLPRSLQDHFWRHPRRRAVRQVGLDSGRGRFRDARKLAEGGLEPGRRHLDDSQLWRLLAINRRLNSSLSTQRVLEFAMDTAIDLTGAERGFILLASETDGDDGAQEEGPSLTWDVPVARNVERGGLEQSEMSFSRTIAAQVIATGEPVVTVDAQQDERFRANSSVHAMKVTAVCAVPIRVPSGVLGALYLDNRYQRGRFEAPAEQLLLAFADQVALALRNAQLHAALQRRTEQLEVEKKKVDELSQQQAEQIDQLTEEVQARQDVLELRYDYSNIIGRSAPMRRVLATVDRVVDSALNVLIQGESGTGKELIARAIHFNGPRRNHRFLSLNCAALPDSLLESELFGYRRGAFTHAERDREGLFLQAQGGTVFLDEVGETSLAMQTKLLRVLQEREVTPLGATKPISVDFRLVCATNRQLREEVAAGRFREDLYYRIAVVVVTLPPLRERGSDILALARALLERVAAESDGQGPGQGGTSQPRLSRDAQRALLRYGWPGNVRQLENVLSRAWLFAPDGRLTAVDLELPQPRPRKARARDRREYEKVERQRILEALTEHRWNVCEVSRVLGIPRTTLYRKLERYRLARPEQ